MKKLDHFEKSQRALERSLFKGKQSLVVYKASQEAIERSLRLMGDLQCQQPMYRTTVQ